MAWQLTGPFRNRYGLEGPFVFLSYGRTPTGPASSPIQKSLALRTRSTNNRSAPRSLCQRCMSRVQTKRERQGCVLFYIRVFRTFQMCCLFNDQRETVYCQETKYLLIFGRERVITSMENELKDKGLDKVGETFTQGLLLSGGSETL